MASYGRHGVYALIERNGTVNSVFRAVEPRQLLATVDATLIERINSGQLRLVRLLGGLPNWAARGCAKLLLRRPHRGGPRPILVIDRDGRTVYGSVLAASRALGVTRWSIYDRLQVIDGRSVVSMMTP